MMRDKHTLNGWNDIKQKIVQEKYTELKFTD